MIDCFVPPNLNLYREASDIWILILIWIREYIIERLQERNGIQLNSFYFRDMTGCEKSDHSNRFTL